MEEKLQRIQEEAAKQIKESDSLEKLNEVRVAFLGKKGERYERRGSGRSSKGRTVGQRGQRKD